MKILRSSRGRHSRGPTWALWITLTGGNIGTFDLDTGGWVDAPGVASRSVALDELVVSYKDAN